MTILPSRSIRFCFEPVLVRRWRRNTCATANGRWWRHCGWRRSGRKSSPQHSAARDRDSLERRRDDHCRSTIGGNDFVLRSCRLHRTFVPTIGGILSDFWTAYFRNLIALALERSRRSRRSAMPIWWPAASWAARGPRTAVADMALAMIGTLERMNRDLPTPLQMRIGIHSGEVVAGVIGTHNSSTISGAIGEHRQPAGIA